MVRLNLLIAQSAALFLLLCPGGQSFAQLGQDIPRWLRTTAFPNKESIGDDYFSRPVFDRLPADYELAGIEDEVQKALERYLPWGPVLGLYPEGHRFGNYTRTVPELTLQKFHKPGVDDEVNKSYAILKFTYQAAGKFHDGNFSETDEKYRREFGVVLIGRRQGKVFVVDGEMFGGRAERDKVIANWISRFKLLPGFATSTQYQFSFEHVDPILSDKDMKRKRPGDLIAVLRNSKGRRIVGREIYFFKTLGDDAEIRFNKVLRFPDKEPLLITSESKQLLKNAKLASDYFFDSTDAGIKRADWNGAIGEVRLNYFASSRLSVCATFDFELLTKYLKQELPVRAKVYAVVFDQSPRKLGSGGKLAKIVAIQNVPIEFKGTAAIVKRGTKDLMKPAVVKVDGKTVKQAELPYYFANASIQFDGDAMFEVRWLSGLHMSIMAKDGFLKPGEFAQVELDWAHAGGYRWFDQKFGGYVPQAVFSLIPTAIGAYQGAKVGWAGGPAASVIAAGLVVGYEAAQSAWDKVAITYRSEVLMELNAELESWELFTLEGSADIYSSRHEGPITVTGGNKTTIAPSGEVGEVSSFEHSELSPDLQVLKGFAEGKQGSSWFSWFKPIALFSVLGATLLGGLVAVLRFRKMKSNENSHGLTQEKRGAQETQETTSIFQDELQTGLENAARQPLPTDNVAQQETRFCVGCGHPIARGSQFCGSCGHVIERSPANTQHPTADPEPKLPATGEHATRPLRPQSEPLAAEAASKTTDATTVKQPTKSGKRWLLTLSAALIVVAIAIGLIVFLPDALIPKWAGAKYARAIIPGKTKLSALADSLGSYEQVGTYGNNLEWIRYRVNDEGLESVTVWLDANRTVRWAKLVPTHGLKRKSLQKSLPYMDNAWSMSTGNLFTRESEKGDTLQMLFGNYLYVVGDEVKEFWKVDLDSLEGDIHRVLRAIQPAPDRRPLNVSGSGKFSN